MEVNEEAYAAEKIFINYSLQEKGACHAMQGHGGAPGLVRGRRKMGGPGPVVPSQRKAGRAGTG